MPRDDALEHAGFHSYADGTPRDFERDPAGGAPAAHWSETPAYLAFEEPQSTPDWKRIAVAAGAAAGLTAAAAFGWTALQRRDASPPAQAAAGAAPSGVKVVVADLPAPPPPAAGGRLEVLPSGPALVVRPAGATPPAETVLPSTPPADPPVVASTAPRREARAAWRRAPAPRNGFDNCADAPTLARRMVCADMRLAAADQRMKEAYAAALAAGAPYRRLAREQEDWLELREDAAHVSRGAVLSAYRQRTRELWAAARDR